jgi:hypothetical protein
MVAAVPIQIIGKLRNRVEFDDYFQTCLTLEQYDQDLPD